MSDFDFDELDKAVAGVVGSSTDNTSFDAAPELEAESQSAPRVQPSPELTEAQKNVPAARRTSGRFMDVVHPSSDMRTRASTVAAQTSSKLTDKPSFIPPSIPKQEVPKEESSTPEGGYGAGEWSKPLETPFLPDTKVEKRPLGGVGPEPNLVLLDAPEEELLLEAPGELRIEEHTLPDPIDFAAHIASLSSEKEDTGEIVQSSPELLSDIPKETVDETSEQTIEQLDELVEPEQSKPVLEVKTSHEPTGPTSINQQYTEQPQAQQESGAIYDTENYHQPLTPVAKKHSSALTIIGIIVLIALGAGAGVAFYLFVLPML